MGVNLREAWNRVARADRFVYGAGLVLVLLSFLVHVRAVARYFRHDDPGALAAGTLDLFAPSAFEKNGQGLIIGVAVLFVLGWEVAKEGYRYLSDAGPIVVGLLVSVPVAAPLTALAAWLAKLFTTAVKEEDHPLLHHVLPLPVGVGITVYVVTTALVIVGLKELKDRRDAAT
jgi:hypothetical protein